MQRRNFLAASLATSALGLSQGLSAQAPSNPARQFYLLRRYNFVAGPQTKLAEEFFAGALVPALTRMSIKMGYDPPGVMSLEFGPETPAYFVLIPGSSPDTLGRLDLLLARDAEFMKAAEPFWSAPATAPAFQRVESTLLIAFEGWRKLVTPAESGLKGKRLFQMRTYESPSYAAHVRKVEMFNNGEFGIFQNAGCRPVFFGDTLIGARMPSLTYMLSFANHEEMDACWDRFRNSPEWKKLSSDSHYNYEPIVSNITNLTLTPLDCSQI